MTHVRPELPVGTVRTRYLRVARTDWARLIAGEKTQYRELGNGATNFSAVPYPWPITLYSLPTLRTADMVADARMAVLEDFYREPLGAISEESLAAEGIPNLKEFRRYWKARHSAGFRPLSVVNVYCLSPWREGDRERLGDVLIDYLFGAHL